MTARTQAMAQYRQRARTAAKGRGEDNRDDAIASFDCPQACSFSGGGCP